MLLLATIVTRIALCIVPKSFVGMDRHVAWYVPSGEGRSLKGTETNGHIIENGLVYFSILLISIG